MLKHLYLPNQCQINVFRPVGLIKKPEFSLFTQKISFCVKPRGTLCRKNIGIFNQIYIYYYNNNAFNHLWKTIQIWTFYTIKTGWPCFRKKNTVLYYIMSVTRDGRCKFCRHRNIHDTYGIVHDGLKQFSAHYGLVQFFASTRVTVHVDGVREQTASLSRQYLQRTNKDAFKTRQKIIAINA